ncbi:MAG: hypothetical protein COA58_04310 [Bacteroidetes bacterium]|nr:MAG: hypothetical protein COA58_04310 [Bacteroidota bacterium]
MQAGVNFRCIQSAATKVYRAELEFIQHVERLINFPDEGAWGLMQQNPKRGLVTKRREKPTLLVLLLNI